MRRPLALLAVAAVFLIAIAIWKTRSAPGPTCEWATLERVDFPGGHIAKRWRRAAQTFRLGIHLHADDKRTPCNAGESDDACKARAAQAFGPLPKPADSLDIAIEGTSQHVARATPFYWRTQPSIPHEQQRWEPDRPGARPATGSAFKANFDGAWVAGTLSPAGGGAWLVDVWCSAEDAPMPGTKATHTDGD